MLRADPRERTPVLENDQLDSPVGLVGNTRECSEGNAGVALIARITGICCIGGSVLSHRVHSAAQLLRAV